MSHGGDKGVRQRKDETTVRPCPTPSCGPLKSPKGMCEWALKPLALKTVWVVADGVVSHYLCIVKVF